VTSPILSVQGLRKSFGKVLVIEDLSFDVAEGETLGIVGPNGAGKSTLLNLVNGVLPPTAGTITYRGDDVTRQRASTRARHGIGRSYQVPRPFTGMTVLENLLVPARFAGGASVKQAYERGIASLEATGLTAQANQSAGSLRLLDRKRLELASPRASSSLVRTVSDIKAAGVTIIWIEHVVHALLAVADRMMCLTYGQMLAIGTPHEVMSHPDVRRVYLGSTPEEALG
jgi:branched-chain amino acid transport system ATP-binding protein